MNNFTKWLFKRESLNDIDIIAETVDPSIVASAFGGDQNALGTLYMQAYEAAMKMLYPRRTVNHADAEDVAGDVAMRVLDKVKSGEGESNPSTFPNLVSRIVTHRWMAYKRDTGGHARVLGKASDSESDSGKGDVFGSVVSPSSSNRNLDVFSQEPDDLASVLSGGLKGMIDKEKVGLIRQALNRLRAEKPKWHEYLVKTYRDRMSQADIAQEMGVPYGSVTSGTKRAIEKIRDEYLPDLAPSYQMDWNVVESLVGLILRD